MSLASELKKVSPTDRRTINQFLSLIGRSAATMTGEELHLARIHAGLSVAQATQILRLHSRTTLESIESGQRQLDHDLVRRMNEAYGLLRRSK